MTHRPDLGIFTKLLELRGDLITPYLRVMCGMTGAGMVFLGWGPLLNPDGAAYDRPIFNGVRRWAAIEAWGTGFWLCAVVMLVAALSSRALVYALGVVLCSVTLAGWSAMIILEARVNPDAVLTSGAIGLYLLSFTCIVGIAFSPRQLSGEKEILGQISDDGSLVPMRRLEQPAVDGDRYTPRAFRAS